MSQLMQKHRSQEDIPGKHPKDMRIIKSFKVNISFTEKIVDKLETMDAMLMALYTKAYEKSDFWNEFIIKVSTNSCKYMTKVQDVETVSYFQRARFYALKNIATTLKTRR